MGTGVSSALLSLSNLIRISIYIAFLSFYHFKYIFKRYTLYLTLCSLGSTITLILFKFSVLLPKCFEVPLNIYHIYTQISPSFLWSSPRPISITQLHTLLHFHLWPIYHIVYVGPYSFQMGYLIFRGASRLDAFSVYPCPTWLPGRAIGMTTGAPAVRPFRSSRTRNSSSQISSACDR